MIIIVLCYSLSLELYLLCFRLYEIIINSLELFVALIISVRALS